MAGRLLSRYGRIIGSAEANYEGAQHALVRAIAIARGERDLLLEVQTLTYAHIVSGQHLRSRESVDNGLRASNCPPEMIASCLSRNEIALMEEHIPGFNRAWLTIQGAETHKEPLLQLGWPRQES